MKITRQVASDVAALVTGAGYIMLGNGPAAVLTGLCWWYICMLRNAERRYLEADARRWLAERSLMEAAGEIYALRAQLEHERKENEATVGTAKMIIAGRK